MVANLNNLNMDHIKKWIKAHEGFSKFPYKDTVGKITIGYGRNIEDNGISADEADFMLNNDIYKAIDELKGFSWFMLAPTNAQIALINMCFNMGMPRLLGFKKMIYALIEKDYTKAAIEALDSKWAKQVGNRAKDIAVMLREA